jgi:hypothetical protein
MTRTLILTAALAWVGLPLVAEAQDSADRMVTQFYRRYLGRWPSPEEVANWANQLRAGTSLQTVEAGFLGSDEYYRRNGADPWEYVASLYRDVLGRYPSASEVQGQLNGWRALRGDRMRFAQEFLKGAELERRTQPRRSLPPLPLEEYRYRDRVIPDYRRW